MKTSGFPQLFSCFAMVVALLVMSSSGQSKDVEQSNWAMARISGLETSLGKPMPTNLEELIDFAGVSHDVDAENYCLAQAIYFEARSETIEGQFAVGRVVLNRVNDARYPDTICGVVFQNQNWVDRCQFSFACDRIRDRVKNRKLFKVAQHVAEETTAGRIWLPQVGSSTHYHATYVNPRWNRKMKRVGKIGLHIFYRTYGGGWS